MAITKITYHQKNGVRVKEERPMTAREVKAEIMKNRGWDKATYQKQYDLFKNKLRAFESYERAHGKKVKPQSPAEVLYRQAKAMAREGNAYQPSITMQRIMSFSAVSITKGRELAKDMESAYSKNRAKTYASATQKAFEKFINDVPKAKEIDDNITDPVKKEQALAKLADHIHAKMKSDGTPVPDGETYGSDVAGDDFDYSAWLD